MSDLSIVLGGLTLPDQTKLIETTTPLEKNNVTLDGSMYTDFTSNRRSWQVSFGTISRSEYEDIRTVYRTQFDEETYPTLVVSSENIDTAVKMNLTDRSLRFNGDCVEEFGLTLQEGSAYF